MSYAIIRNTNYKKNQLNGLYRHIERKNTNYSNKDIEKENSIKNYSLKKPLSTYEKQFNEIKKQYNLKGQIKSVSNVASAFIITSDSTFFESIGENETKRFFRCAYSFVANYKQLGEQYILSAKVHMDERTPHMHILFIPVVHTKDKNGNQIDKISCSEFWKGKNSYKILQNNFYKYIEKCGFDLERGKSIDNEHIPIEKLKAITNYDKEAFKEAKTHFETFSNSNNVTSLKRENIRVISKYNTLANRYVKIKNTVDNTLNLLDQEKKKNFELSLKNTQLKHDNEILNEDIENLEKENTSLKKYIEKIFEVISITFDYPKKILKEIVDNYFNKIRFK